MARATALEPSFQYNVILDVPTSVGNETSAFKGNLSRSLKVEKSERGLRLAESLPSKYEGHGLMPAPYKLDVVVCTL